MTAPLPELPALPHVKGDRAAERPASYGSDWLLGEAKDRAEYRAVAILPRGRIATARYSPRKHAAPAGATKEAAAKPRAAKAKKPAS